MWNASHDDEFTILVFKLFFKIKYYSITYNSPNDNAAFIEIVFHSTLEMNQY